MEASFVSTRLPASAFLGVSWLLVGWLASASGLPPLPAFFYPAVAIFVELLVVCLLAFVCFSSSCDVMM